MEIKAYEIRDYGGNFFYLRSTKFMNRGYRFALVDPEAWIISCFFIYFWR